MDLAADSSFTAGHTAPEPPGARLGNFDMALENYYNIQLPSSEAQLSQDGNFLRHLTHPSQIRKRNVAGKRKLPGGEEGGSMVARKKKKTCRDQVDVFDHLATLHRKQMEMEVPDSQEVPSSPQIAPCDYFPSFHSTQPPSKIPCELAPCDPPRAKRVLFAQETSSELEEGDGEEGVPTALFPWNEEEERNLVPPTDRIDRGSGSTSNSHSSMAARIDQTPQHDLEDAPPIQAALVPVLTAPSPSYLTRPRIMARPHLMSPPSSVPRPPATVPRPHLMSPPGSLPIPQATVLRPHLVFMSPPSSVPLISPSSHLVPVSRHVPLSLRPQPSIPGSVLRPHYTAPVPHLTTPVLRPHLPADFSGNGARPTATSGLRPHSTSVRPHPSGLRLPPDIFLANLLPSSSNNRDPEPLDVRNFSILHYYPREE